MGGCPRRSTVTRVPASTRAIRTARMPLYPVDLEMFPSQPGRGTGMLARRKMETDFVRTNVMIESRWSRKISDSSSVASSVQGGVVPSVHQRSTSIAWVERDAVLGSCLASLGRDTWSWRCIQGRIHTAEPSLVCFPCVEGMCGSVVKRWCQR